MDFNVAREKMVASQVKTAEVTDPLIVDVMGAVPREKFVPANKQAFAYLDEDLAIGNGRYVMEPMVVARLLQLADIERKDSVLVVGAATGYVAALASQMAESVVALECDPALADRAAKTFAELNFDNVKVVVGKLESGWTGPFDAIVVDGAIENVPQEYQNQLKDGGRLVCVVREGPVGRATQTTRAGESFCTRQEFDAMTPCLPGFEEEQKFVF